MEDILNMRIDEISFIERPPMEAGKIVKIDVGVSQFGDKEAQTLTLYIIDKETEFIRRQTIKVSNRKPSKFSILIEKLKEAGFRGAIKDLEGKIFRWEYRELEIGNFKTNMWVPVELVGEEPVTQDELDAVAEYEANLQSLNSNDDLLQIR